MCSELSKVTNPLAGMGWGQRIATVALVLLALIAGMAFLAQGGTSDPSSHATHTPWTGDQATNPGSTTPSGRRSSDGGLDTISASDLPAEARRTLALIDAGGPFPYSRDGVVYNNYNGALPQHPRGWYHEYTVKTPGATNRGARRIITGKDSTSYYTPDHYKTFEQVQR